MNASRLWRSAPLIRKFWTKKQPEFGKYEIVEPQNVSPQKVVPDHIPKPSYYITGHPTETIQEPEIKTKEQILGMRRACKLAANILSEVGKSVKVGQTTDEIDCLTHKLIIDNGAYPSPLNYKFFPKSVCTSVNNVACHGIPDDRPLADGDIINIDITVYLNSYHGDCSKTFLVGNVDDYGVNLTETTLECLNEAIDYCGPGKPFWRIGALIEDTAYKLGFTVIPAFSGHGIGEYFHGPPDIFNVENSYPGTMEKGMTFTIEPILSPGSEEIVILEDGWTAVTYDCARTAQFEHTILITEDGAERLTVPD